MLQDADGCTALHKATSQVPVVLQSMQSGVQVQCARATQIQGLANDLNHLALTPKGHGGQTAEIWNEAMTPPTRFQCKRHEQMQHHSF